MDKLTNQKFGNFNPLRMVTASSIVHVKEEDNGWSYANQGSKTTLSQFVKQLSQY